MAQNDHKESFLGSWETDQCINGFQCPGEFKSKAFFHIHKQDDGSLAGSFAIPARRVNNLPLAKINIEGDSLSFIIRGFGVPFNGILSEDGSNIKGKIGQESLIFNQLDGFVDSAIFDNPFKESYQGITNDGTLQDDLFPIRATGVSTAPIVRAAKRFVGILSSSQQEKVRFPVNSDEWRHWTNSPYLERKGISLRELSDQQREAAFSLMKAGLSVKGFQLSRNIMRMEGYIANLTGDKKMFGELLYHVTILGEPSTKEPWGWQIDGHHLIINYFVLGDQVIMTPSFFGTEPAVIDTGRYAGTEVLQKEQNKGLHFMQSLSQDQQKKAKIGNNKTKEELLSAPFQDNIQIDFAGISVDQLETSQKENLLDLIRLYVNNMRKDHAEVRMEQVRKHLDDTHFVWHGKVDEEAVYYYRIHSPVILIEFDHALPRSLPDVKKKTPYRDHIHTVIRTPNGNDYGKSLLQKHYEKHADNPNHRHHK